MHRSKRLKRRKRSLDPGMPFEFKARHTLNVHIGEQSVTTLSVTGELELNRSSDSTIP